MAAKIYDIKNVSITVDGVTLVDVADGVGITPKNDTKLISTVFGEVGFSLDPSTAADVTISLQSTSPNNAMMRSIAIAKKVVPVSLKSKDPDSTGFTEIAVDYCIFAPAEKAMSGESPKYQYKGTAFGYSEK